MKLIFKAPLNGLSFGQVSYNLLKVFYNLGIDVAIFPVNNSADISAFAPDDQFKMWIKDSIENRFKKMDSKAPCLNLWHLNGAEQHIGKKPFLYTFHEVDGVTAQEKTIIEMHEKVFVPSLYTKDVFDCNNVVHAPIGFDKEQKISNKRKFPEEMLHFILIGKFEKRKHTSKILKNWAEKFGGNRKYQLTCLINNPFIGDENVNWEITKALNSNKFFNINFMPFLKTNKQVNDLVNSADIDLSGLSGGEGWGLPAFNATALGKWSCVLNATAHKDWANENNSILVEPDGKMDAWDGAFFAKGLDFNQGQFYNVSDETICDALSRAVVKAGAVNENGLLLQENFTYEKTVDKILSEIF